jgi:hypothetical protein
MHARSLLLKFGSSQLAHCLATAALECNTVEYRAARQQYGRRTGGFGEEADNPRFPSYDAVDAEAPTRAVALRASRCQSLQSNCQFVAHQGVSGTSCTTATFSDTKIMG